MKRQNRLVVEILKKFHDAGILDNIMLIGSWCSTLYEDYFTGVEYRSMIKTRDIDFLLPTKPVFKQEVDIEKLLKPLGFEMGFFGKGRMKLESDELILEFLIPEVGRSSDKPFPLKQLKFNAQPLRHLSMLWRNPIEVFVSGFSCRLPHPADYCLQKLITAANRKRAEKCAKDRQTALNIIDAIREIGDLEELSVAYQGLTAKQKGYIKREMVEIGHKDLLEKL